jgi:serine/threonine protein kinase/tetratricopeptide (TPR) repeat protein
MQQSVQNRAGDPVTVSDMSVGARPDDDERTVFLGRTQADAAGDVVPEAQAGPGSRIGPYRLVALLGEGGMGQVFLAEQREPIRRQVALKLIQQQLAGSLAEAYFEVERQALARMDHPAIAKVHDAGRTDEGFPYFAMEFIEGRPLDQWRREDNPDERSRLRAVINLAYGIQHAHQRGIVHRDVKPTNVIMTMVDGRPQPKLIDFGIAVGVDQQMSASSRDNYERAGSGPYMSPEQFAGDAGSVDIRTDVYSMGVLLLSLLLPLPGLRSLGEPIPEREVLHKRLVASLRQRGIEPALDTVPAELRHIVATAVHPNRDRRYSSVMALAQDIQHYLDGYVVDAVPSSNRYRIRKFIRRRRRPLLMAAAAFLALIVGFTVAVWGFIEAGRQARRSQVTSEFLATVLSSVDPDRARDMDKTLLREVLDTAATRADTELRDQPDALAEIETAIAASYESLSEYVDAEKHARRAHELMRVQFGVDDERTLEATRRWGRGLVEIGEARQSVAVLREASEHAVRRLGADAPIALRVRKDLAWSLRETGDYKAGYEEASETLAIQSRALGDDHPDTMDSQFAVAILLSDLERWDESIDLFKALIARRSRVSGPEHTTTLSLKNSLAVAYLQSRRFADGEAVMREMSDAYDRVFGPTSAESLMLSGNMGGALRQQGKVEESGPYYQRAYEGYLAKFGLMHPRTIQGQHNYGNYLLDARRFDEAYTMQQGAVQNGLKTFGEKHPVVGEALTGLGRAAAALHRHDEAEASLLASLSMKEELLGANSGRLQSTRDALADLYDAMNRPEDAARYRAASPDATAASVP